MKTNRRETKDVHQKVVRRIGVERRGGEGAGRAETQRNVREREWKRRDERERREEGESDRDDRVCSGYCLRREKVHQLRDRRTGEGQRRRGKKRRTEGTILKCDRDEEGGERRGNGYLGYV